MTAFRQVGQTKSRSLSAPLCRNEHRITVILENETSGTPANRIAALKICLRLKSLFAVSQSSGKTSRRINGQTVKRLIWCGLSLPGIPDAGGPGRQDGGDTG
jgi:hypothetical protein